jgi:hypothetical protein
MIALLHGDAPFGWQGFGFAILMTLAFVIIVKELTRGLPPKRPRKRMRHLKNGKRAH